MNTMPMETASLSTIAQCWLYRNHTHMLMQKGTPVSLLPSVEAKHKQFLDELAIPNRLICDGNICEFWNPDCYAEANVSLPLYVQMNNVYRWIKNYTGTVVSTETSVAAHALYEEMVKPEIERMEKEEQQKKLISDLKKVLAGRPACGIDCNRNSNLTNIRNKELDIHLGDDHIKVFPVHTLVTEERKQRMREQYWNYCGVELSTSSRSEIQTDYIAIFDMSQMKVGTSIELQVPVGTEPIFIGRQGWQVKEWCEKAGGLLKINVKGAVGTK